MSQINTQLQKHNKRDVRHGFFFFAALCSTGERVLDSREKSRGRKETYQISLEFYFQIKQTGS